ncbi:helix-turn-helix transcriptional regulator [Hydrococcus rivularis NIES-593]|uniref:Helix-turn-helix transcriptional regulator n=2 Tax=Hydrococcus TaxID=1616833 RepID=A0A1U7HPP5_9CYAN|nr:helix-turn-helix transcriptional regulator [Hydrococcus rivularis NIES-593]
MTRVLVHATNPIARAGLESIIRAQPDFEIVGSSSDLNALMQLDRDRQPDAILLEWLETDEEFFWEPLLSDETSDPAIVILTDRIEGDRAIEILSTEVRAVLPRTATPEEILATVAAAAGPIVLHPNLVESWLNVNPFRTQALPAEPTEALTQREVEVLQILAQGLGNKAIASRLSISEHTVKFHIGSISAKLNATSRTEAVTLGLRQGLIML